MVVGKSVFGEQVSPNVYSVIIERPRFLVDLNEPVDLSPEIQAELHPSFESLDGNFSDHVDFPTTGQDNAISEADEMRFLMSSAQQTLRSLLNITPTSLDHACRINIRVSSVGEECNKIFDCTINPSKITKQRPHSFLSPLNKKRQHGQALL